MLRTDLLGSRSDWANPSTRSPILPNREFAVITFCLSSGVNGIVSPLIEIVLHFARTWTLNCTIVFYVFILSRLIAGRTKFLKLSFSKFLNFSILKLLTSHSASILFSLNINIVSYFQPSQVHPSLPAKLRFVRAYGPYYTLVYIWNWTELFQDGLYL